MQEKEEKARNQTTEAGEIQEPAQEDLKKKRKKDDKKDEVVESLEKKLAEQEAAAKKLQDSILYLQADFDNFKKLKAKEREDTLKYGNEVLIKELLPVIDNLQRALSHAAQTEEAKSITEGVELTLNQFLKILEKSGVTVINAVGKRFDPTVHEAFFQEERDDVEPETVVSEYQKGYLLNGRLVRPAVVVIAKQPETV